MKKLFTFIKEGKLEEVLGCIVIAIVIIPVIINIVNRSVFSFYSVPLEVTALLAYVWIGYGFFGFLYKKDAHVDMRFIVNKMPPKVKAVSEFFRDILIFVFSAYLVYWGIKLFMTNTTRYATGTKIPLALGYASIIFGFFSGSVRSFCSIVRRVAGIFKKGEMKQ